MDSIINIFFFLLGGLFLSILNNILPKYLGKKAENLATKEDVEAITEQIERIKHVYDERKEMFRSREKLRLAALDKRLQTYQEAYTFWQKILEKIHSTEIEGLVKECQDWWNNNCLYLDPDSRKSFKQAYVCAHQHQRITSSSDPILERENWNSIILAGECILRGADLPSLGIDEQKRL